MRTLSTSETAFGSDLDNTIVDGIESLSQRIRQALLLRFGEWFMDTRRGLPDVIGTRMPVDLAQVLLTDYVRSEGGDEVTGVRDVVASLDHETRTLEYSAVVDTIYGPMPIQEAIQ